MPLSSLIKYKLKYNLRKEVNLPGFPFSKSAIITYLLTLILFSSYIRMAIFTQHLTITNYCFSTIGESNFMMGFQFFFFKFLFTNSAFFALFFKDVNLNEVISLYKQLHPKLQKLVIKQLKVLLEMNKIPKDDG